MLYWKQEAAEINPREEGRGSEAGVLTEVWGGWGGGDRREEGERDEGRERIRGGRGGVVNSPLVCAKENPCGHICSLTRTGL